jgi:predicted urease superfamily metal-dependent hydrolase
MSTLTLSTRQTLSPAADAAYELEALAELALELQMKAKQADEEAKAATDAFRQALEAAGKLNEDTKAVGIVRTTLYPTRRFSEDLARSIMTKKLAKECEKTVLDSNAVKRNVSPADYERMQSVTGWTMKLSVDKG